MVLRRAKPKKSNIDRSKREALISIRKNKDIVILKVYKGGEMMVMNHMDYTSNMIEHLIMNGIYRNLGSNPILKVIKKVNKVISGFILDPRMKKQLTLSCEITPRIYGLPKIHKEGAPLRHVIKIIGSPMYVLVKYMSKILSPLFVKTKSFIKYSNDFVRLIKDDKVEPKDILINFDIVSLSLKFLWMR